MSPVCVDSVTQCVCVLCKVKNNWKIINLSENGNK